MDNKTVKARERQGSNSLDLTLPTEIRKKYNISKGDIFKITVKEDDDNLKIIYELVYKN